MDNNIMQLFLYVWYKINIRKRRDIGMSFEMIEKFIFAFSCTNYMSKVHFCLLKILKNANTFSIHLIV